MRILDWGFLVLAVLVAGPAVAGNRSESVPDSMSLLDLPSDLDSSHRTQVVFSKDVVVKVVNGQIEDDVWFQNGAALYSSLEINRSKPFCKLDTNPESGASADIVIHGGTATLVTSKVGRLYLSPTVFHVFIGLSRSNPFLSNIQCNMPETDLREPTAGDLRSITGNAIDLVLLMN